MVAVLVIKTLVILEDETADADALIEAAAKLQNPIQLTGIVDLRHALAFQ